MDRTVDRSMGVKSLAKGREAKLVAARGLAPSDGATVAGATLLVTGSTAETGETGAHILPAALGAAGTDTVESGGTREREASSCTTTPGTTRPNRTSKTTYAFGRTNLGLTWERTEELASKGLGLPCIGWGVRRMTARASTGVVKGTTRFVKGTTLFTKGTTQNVPEGSYVIFLYDRYLRLHLGWCP